MRIWRNVLFAVLFGFINILTAGNYQMVRVYIHSSQDLEQLARLGVDFEGSRYKENTFVDLQLSLQEKEKIEQAGFQSEVLIADLERFYQDRLERRSGKGFGYGSMGGFYTLSEVMAQLDSMIAQYPTLISRKDTIGYSVLGRPIVAVCISDNPNVPENEPEVLFTGLHHAREPMSMMTILYYMWYLLENYGSDPQATYLVNNRQIWFVPVVNPDGYWHNQQTNPNGGGMWRLNGRDNNDNGIFFESNIDGVDLNRNYGYMWGYDNNGSSPTPGSQTYRGVAPFSESETWTIKNFCEQHQFTAAFNYHSYSDLLIHPWAYNDSPTPDHFLFHTYGLDLTQFNGYVLGTPGQTVGYAVNGDANDWMYGEQTTKAKIIAYTPEVGTFGDGFWPSTSRIIPLAQENLYPNIRLSYIAGPFPQIALTQTTIYGANSFPDPGEVVEITPSIMNYGLKPTGAVTVELVPRSNAIHMLHGTVQVPPMNTFDTTTVTSPWRFQIDYSATPGETAILDVYLYESGTLVSVDSMEMLLGTPDLFLSDDAENGMVNWSTNGSWGVTASSAHSPSHSFTDSPGGNYPNNANIWLKSQPIDLTGATGATLSYWTHWEIENNWDFGVVEISTNNGVTWQHLVAPHMDEASGSGTQQTGLHGYDGTQNSWVYEEIDLSAYVGQTVYLRFRLMSDGSINEDGWYLDDIQILQYSPNANIPPYISSVSNPGFQQYTGQPYPVDAIIVDNDSIASAEIYYSTDDGQTFQSVSMTGNDSLYTGYIPPLGPGSSVRYYVEAIDNQGSYSRYPYNAPDSLLSFTILGTGPAIAVSPSQLNFTVPQLFWQQQSLTISNPGNQPLTFTITDSIVAMPGSRNGMRTATTGMRELLLHQLREVVPQQVSPETSTPSAPSISTPENRVVIVTDTLGDVTDPHLDIQSISLNETMFSWEWSIAFGDTPSTDALLIISIDLDQNFGTGTYPVPLGYGPGNFDLGAEYEMYFDLGNRLGDTLGIPASVFVINMQDTSLMGIPVPMQINGNTVSVTLLKALYPIGDTDMNIGAMMLPLRGIPIPDMAPDYGHGVYGQELGCSWVTELDSTGTAFYPFTGTVAPGDSVTIEIKVAAAYPMGSYQAALKIANNSSQGMVEVPVTMQILSPGEPNIAVAPASISDTLEQNGTPVVHTIEISNTGNAMLLFTVRDSVSTDSNWIQLSSTYGAVSPGETYQLEVILDPMGLAANNSYSGQVIILSNDPDAQQTVIPVEMYLHSSSGIVSTTEIPTTLQLRANYPNPFNPSTTIAFDLPRRMQVKLEVFNILGQRVAVLVNKKLAPGRYHLTWQARSTTGEPLPSGIYFYRLQADNQTRVRKMLLTR